MNKDEIRSLVNRLDNIGILNPATYQLGLNDDPNKRRFMDDYTDQMQWITDAYAVLKEIGYGEEQSRSSITRAMSQADKVSTKASEE